MEFIDWPEVWGVGDAELHCLVSVEAGGHVLFVGLARFRSFHFRPLKKHSSIFVLSILLLLMWSGGVCEKPLLRLDTLGESDLVKWLLLLVTHPRSCSHHSTH